MPRSRINKSRYRLNKNRVSKRKKYMLRGGEIIKYKNGDNYNGDVKRGEKNGKGIMKYKFGTVYDGDWRDDKRNGRGKLSFPCGQVYEGEWKDDKRNGRGKYTFPCGHVYEGEWKDDKKNGRGKLTYPDGRFYEGEYKDDKRNGTGTIYLPAGYMRGEFLNDNAVGLHTYYQYGLGKTKTYFYIDGKVYTIENNLMKYIILGMRSKQVQDAVINGMGWNDELIAKFKGINGPPNGARLENWDLQDALDWMDKDLGDEVETRRAAEFMVNVLVVRPDRYITILINLHGSDLINSECRLTKNMHHVRCISPVQCGMVSLNTPENLKNAFQIAYNISHLQFNNGASSYQKIMKIIEIYNTHDSSFYDLTNGALSRPLIDHFYYIKDIPDMYKQIFIIDTNHMIDLFQERFNLFTQKNTELISFVNIENYNILSNLSPLLNIQSGGFLRSTLINVLLDLGYNTINIIDLSCRGFDRTNHTSTYTEQSGKNYVCKYTENPDETLQNGDDIKSPNF